MENHDFAFKGIWIPAELFLDERLSMTDKVVWAVLHALDGDGGCYASNDYIAERCQCSKRQVTQSVSKLKSAGYVWQESFDGRRRVLRTSTMSAESVKAAAEAYVGVADVARKGSKICYSNQQNLLPNNKVNKKGKNTDPCKANALQESVCGGHTQKPRGKGKSGKTARDGGWSLDEVTALAESLGCDKLLSAGKVETLYRYANGFPKCSKSAVAKRLLSWEENETGEPPRGTRDSRDVLAWLYENVPDTPLADSRDAAIAAAETEFGVGAVPDDVLGAYVDEVLGEIAATRRGKR